MSKSASSVNLVASSSSTSLMVPDNAAGAQDVSSGHASGRRGLEAKLLGLPRYTRRVVACEAGAADRILRELRSLLHPVYRQVVERRRADVHAHLLDGAVRGGELILVGHIDPVETR